MKASIDRAPQIDEAICKIRCYLVACILLIVFCTGSAFASSVAKEILSPAERAWLTQNRSRIVLAVETGYAPFLFIDPKDQPQGLAHDYMHTSRGGFVMLTQNNIDARMSALSSTVSDLLVGLKCSDAPEVERVTRRLKDRAKEYGLSLVSLTAHQIEKTSVAGDLDAAHQLVAELKEQLQQAPLLMRQTAGNRE